MNDITQIQENIKYFIKTWTGRIKEKEDEGEKLSEKGNTSQFWIDLLMNAFNKDSKDITSFIEFKKQVKHINETIGYIDVFIKNTRVLIEQKSSNIDFKNTYIWRGVLSEAEGYARKLSYSENPRWIVLSNFKTFLIYDRERPQDLPKEILLENLGKEYEKLNFLIDEKYKEKKRERISRDAGEIIGNLYNAFSKQYKDKDSEKAQKDLNELCVRLVFCFYADDSGLFGERGVFKSYLEKSKDDLNIMRLKLINIFKILDTKEDKRDKYLEEELKRFPYVNGGLFSNEEIEIPNFTEEIKENLLEEPKGDFRWSEITPTIFGSVFESTLNPDTRRKGGMHYTSIENIHKVIDPLFLDDLNKEIEEIMELKKEGNRRNRLEEFREKLGKLKFFDPACGSGNFLTETYLSLRKLENEALQEMFNRNLMFEDIADIKVKIQQFYGIEVNDFAVKVAKTALWIAEAQMWEQTKNILHGTKELEDFLPLKTYENIKEGNACRMNWEEVISNKECNYIIGNPPFRGFKEIKKDTTQREDINIIFNGWKRKGNLDYVSCWFKKTTDYIKGTGIKCSLVSTSSIVQGVSVGILWKRLFEDIQIHFAYKPFKWDQNEKVDKKSEAQVICVIIGFCNKGIEIKEKYIYDKGSKKEVRNINVYLMDGENVFPESISEPLSYNVPKMQNPCIPLDGGNLIIAGGAEYEEFIKKEPKAKKYIKKLLTADAFLKNKKRYCLWLEGVSPTEIKSMPLVMERVEKCREFRLKSKRKETVKLAETPYRFSMVYNYDKYMVVPVVSSGNRKYIPMGFIYNKDTVSTNANLIIKDADLYHFGILESIVHMTWMKVVCGRLGEGYRYSVGVVYNNFPWPEVNEEQRGKIKETAQSILDARAKYPNSSLEDLYNETLMPEDLRKAHEANDKAVKRAYGFKQDITEEEIFTELTKMYSKLKRKNTQREIKNN